jgi:hypothetical protein
MKQAGTRCQLNETFCKVACKTLKEYIAFEKERSEKIEVIIIFIDGFINI